MSQHRKLIAAQNVATDSSEDDSDFSVQTAQDRLKRKIFIRKLMVGICIVLLLIVISVGVAVGVLFGTKSKKYDHNDNLAHSSWSAVTYSSSAANTTSIMVTSTTNTAAAYTTSIIMVTSTTNTAAAYTTVTSIIMVTSTTNTGHTSTHMVTPTPTPSPTAAPPGNLVNSSVLDYIDTSYDPCENFYNYSCGNWNNSHPNASEWGTFEELGSDNYNKLAGYLSQNVSSHDPDAIKKAKYLYSACMDTDYINKTYVRESKSFMINKGGGWKNGGLNPSESWSINGSLYEDHYLGSSAFFSFEIVPDDKNSSKPVITIYQDGLTYGSPEEYTDEYYDLAWFIEDIFEELDVHGYDQNVSREISDFEKILASNWVNETELRNATAVYNPMTLDELTEIFSMDWVNYFNKYFEKAGYSGNFSGSTVVIVGTPSYFRAVNSYLTSSVVEDYAKWQLLVNTWAMYTAPLLDDQWKILRDLKFPKTLKFAELTCVEHLENTMPLAVARPFVEEFITNSTKLKVGEVAEQIKTAFKQRISEKDWLDEFTKNQCKAKVDAITEQIAYPDFIKIDQELNSVYAGLNISYGINFFMALRATQNFTVKKMISTYFHPIDKTQWLDPPTEVNAYYSPQFNQFVILAGILRPPFYAPNWFPFLIYGGIATVIGHELTHGFDNEGQQYNKDGNHIKWWSDDSIKNFKNRTQCFVNQYDQYTLQGYRINGQFTLGENIADNGGIHTAFRAYKNVMNGASEQVGEHSGDQLFFVAFAQLWCSKFTDDAVKSDIETDPHSPGPIRVLGTMVNSEEFSNAFNCSRGSTMYPSDDRCELW